MSGKKKATKTNKKTQGAKITSKRASKSKVITICSICAVLITTAIICAVIFIPKNINNDADYPSSFPDYFSNLKEEKEAFARALSSCNKVAEAKLDANGVKTEYRETNLDIINKYAGYNSRINAAYIELGNVNPTGGDTEYKDYGMRTYHCYANISGASVYELNVIWDEKDD